MHDTNKTPPKLLLVDGDPILGMNYILAMKKKWSEDANEDIQWHEMVPPGKKNPSDFLNLLDAEVATSDLAGFHKIVFLRGLANSKQFKDGMMTVVKSVAKGNTFLVFDETGVIKSDGGSKKGDVQKSGWSTFRDYFIKNGEIASVPPPFMSIGEIPWGARFGTEHVRAVVAEVEKRGKKISSQVVRDVFLERVMPDWSFILMEIDKLVELVSGTTITSKDVIDITFPWEQKHAIFEFSNVFNDGKYQSIMNSYDDLIGCKIPPEMLFSFCMKLVRWQMIATHLLSYGQKLPSALDSIGSLMNYERAYANTEKLRQMKPNLFKKVYVEDKKDGGEQKSEGITPFISRGVSHYVKDVLTRRIPVRNGELGTMTIMSVVMRNYLTMVSCMEDYRLSGDPSQARPIFQKAMKKICGGT